MQWVIHKGSSAPTDKSYMGIAWKRAGIERDYRTTYTDIVEAERLARILSAFNPVKFIVSSVPPPLSEMKE